MTKTQEQKYYDWLFSTEEENRDDPIMEMFKNFPKVPLPKF